MPSLRRSLKMCLSEEDDGQWTEEEDPNPTSLLPHCPTNGERSSRSASGFLDESATKAVEEHSTPPTSIQTGISCSSASPHASVPQNVEAGSSRSELISCFIPMGFSEELLTRVLKEQGECGAEEFLDFNLTYSAIDKPLSSPTIASSQSEGGFSFFSDEDVLHKDSSGEEGNAKDLKEKGTKLLKLVEMGFLKDDASLAMERCGHDAPIFELVDSIHAALLAEQESEEDEVKDNPQSKKRKRGRPTRDVNTTRPRPSFNLPRQMVGFGLLSDPHRIVHRELPEIATGPPYFYFENVALAPRGVWKRMSENLYGIEPEFVNSSHFCAAIRKRGYIHNLPIDKRDTLLPTSPMTIQEALPMTRKWWPSWDQRTKLNCILTSTPTAKIVEKIGKKMATAGGDPKCPQVQQFVLRECRRWNLVWVGLHKVAPLEPEEMEIFLGFPENHTRGGGMTRRERYQSLGNSFQVDTVGYHLSVLKDLFPHGLRVLSLFSGIGGAEVALHRVGIKMKLVVSVEISEASRNIVKNWWAQTEQTGTLMEIEDVKQLDNAKLKELILEHGGFDLIIGGSPCNNLSGSNRVSRTGLEGAHSSLFYDYSRILHFVRHFQSDNLFIS